MNIDTAYQAVAVITNAESKSFATGMRLLPPEKRRAMQALYALARRIDDIADGPLEPADKLELLASLEGRLDRMLNGELADDTDAVLFASADAVRRFAVPRSALLDLIEGCRRDAAGHAIISEEDLVQYCQLVAGSVGRMSVAVFTQQPSSEMFALADAVGVALQLTNILRDVREDAGLGRSYLPSDRLRSYGLNEIPTTVSEEMLSLISSVAEDARLWFVEGSRLVPLLDRRSGACVAAMMGTYRATLQRILDDPGSVLRGRVSIGPMTKAFVASKALFGRLAALP